MVRQDAHLQLVSRHRRAFQHLHVILLDEFDLTAGHRRRQNHRVLIVWDALLHGVLYFVRIARHHAQHAVERGLQPLIQAKEVNRAQDQHNLRVVLHPYNHPRGARQILDRQPHRISYNPTIRNVQHEVKIPPMLLLHVVPEGFLRREAHPTHRTALAKVQLQLIRPQQPPVRHDPAADAPARVKSGRVTTLGLAHDAQLGAGLGLGRVRVPPLILPGLVVEAVAGLADAGAVVVVVDVGQARQRRIVATLKLAAAFPATNGYKFSTIGHPFPG
uniref:(northern house mosquito) hypothetical protein n=1 Tax=Culex pipiens TaxID=7175 RepID=A0A8D8MNB8_CULPI